MEGEPTIPGKSGHQRLGWTLREREKQAILRYKDEWMSCLWSVKGCHCSCIPRAQSYFFH